MLAEVTANRISGFINSDTKQIMPWDYFPGFFATEKEQHEENIRKVEFENYKERRKAEMQKYNQSRQEMRE